MSRGDLPSNEGLAPPQHTEFQSGQTPEKKPESTHGIDILELIVLTEEELAEASKDLNKAEFKTAYTEASVASLQRLVFSFESLGVTTKIESGIVRVEAEDEKIEKLMEELLRSFLERSKAENIVDAKKLTEARDAANKDAMTGALNINGLETNFFEETKKINKDETYKGVGFVFLDIDHFKKLNDMYGQKVGDEVIMELVKRMQERTRTGDLVARVGGEEIVIVLTNITPKDFDSVAQDFHSYSKEKPITVTHEGEETEINITTSGGGHFLSPDQCREKQPRILLDIGIEKSNEAERRSKELGRDRMTLHHEMERQSDVLTKKEFARKYHKENNLNRRINNLKLDIETSEDLDIREIHTSILQEELIAIEQAVDRAYKAYLARALKELLIEERTLSPQTKRLRAIRERKRMIEQELGLSNP